jgi:RNA polymerase sigma-70 factor, ECF subfamily
MKLGLSEMDAADVVQDVILLLLDKLPKFEYTDGRSFRARLRTVKENKCRERFRSRREVASGGSEPGVNVVPGPTALSDFFNAELNGHLESQALKLINPSSSRRCGTPAGRGRWKTVPPPNWA